MSTDLFNEFPIQRISDNELNKHEVVCSSVVAFLKLNTTHLHHQHRRHMNMSSTVDMPFECKVSVNQSILQTLLDPSTSTSLIGSIDQGTSSSRFLLVTSDGHMLSTAQVEFEQVFPQSSPYNDGGPSASCAGWHEHNPHLIWDSVATCIAKTMEELVEFGLDLTSASGPGNNGSLIKAVGITNQRETTVCWNDRTGRLYYNAIVWDDTRSAASADAVMSEIGSSFEGKAIDALRAKSGLPISSYSAGTRVRWLIDHIPQLQQDLTSPSERPHVRFGTIDSWLIYQLIL